MNTDVCMLTPNRNDQELIKIFAVEFSSEKACYSKMYYFIIKFFTKYFDLECSFLWACIVYFPYLIQKISPTLYWEKFQRYRKVEKLVERLPVYLPIRFYS